MNGKRARNLRRDHIARNHDGDMAGSARNDLNLHADVDETPGQSMGRQPRIGNPQLARLPPLGSEWRSRIVTDTSLSRQQPPQYEVLSKVISRSKRPKMTGPRFGEYESIRAMAEDTSSIVIGFDTEFTSRSDFVGMPGVQSRTIDSYRFAAIHPLDPGQVVLVTILPPYDMPGALSGMRISLERALELVIEEMCLYLHPLASELWSAKGVPSCRTTGAGRQSGATSRSTCCPGWQFAGSVAQRWSLVRTNGASRSIDAARISMSPGSGNLSMQWTTRR